MASERPDLLGKARLLTPLQSEETYAWISPEELLILRPGIPQLCHFPLHRAQDQAIPCMAYHCQFTTGEETPFAEFNYLHANQLLARVLLMRLGAGMQGDKDVIYDASVATLSPDGRYLLWQVSLGRRVASLDGGETINGPGTTEPGHYTWSTELPSAIWLPDSRSWLEIGHWWYKVRRMDQPKRAKTTFVLGWQDGLHSDITAHRCLLLHCPDLPRTREKFMEYDRTGKLPTDTAFLKVKLGGWLRLARRFKIRLPVPGLVGHVPVSPDGHRLAWLIQESVIRRDSMVTHSLWISDLLGREFQEIGIIAERLEPDAENTSGWRGYFPHDLKWSPDGGQISFTYGDNLYAVQGERILIFEHL